MKIVLDSDAGIIEVGGVKISLDLLQHLTAPRPEWLYQIVRNDDVVNISRFYVAEPK